MHAQEQRAAVGFRLAIEIQGMQQAAQPVEFDRFLIAGAMSQQTPQPEPVIGRAIAACKTFMPNHDVRLDPPLQSTQGQQCEGGANGMVDAMRRKGALVHDGESGQPGPRRTLPSVATLRA